MFARFHYSIRPKAIVNTCILVDLGGHAVGFPTNLEDLVLKPTSASQIQTKRQHTKATLTEIQGDEESHSFKSLPDSASSY
jgi:hypothetical protein